MYLCLVEDILTLNAFIQLNHPGHSLYEMLRERGEKWDGPQELNRAVHLGLLMDFVKMVKVLLLEVS